MGIELNCTYLTIPEQEQIIAGRGDLLKEKKMKKDGMSEWIKEWRKRKTEQNKQKEVCTTTALLYYQTQCKTSSVANDSHQNV